MSPTRGALVTGAAVTAAAAVVLTVVVWPDGSGSGPSVTRRRPLRNFRRGRRPVALPQLSDVQHPECDPRGARAHRGPPGWQPGEDSTVVIAKGSQVLADEAELLARS